MWKTCINSKINMLLKKNKSTTPSSAFLQLEISSLERSRSVMAEELVRLTNQNDDMEDKVKEIPKLKIQLKVGVIWLNPYCWLVVLSFPENKGSHVFEYLHVLCHVLFIMFSQWESSEDFMIKGWGDCGELGWWLYNILLCVYCIVHTRLCRYVSIGLIKFLLKTYLCLFKSSCINLKILPSQA